MPAPLILTPATPVATIAQRFASSGTLTAVSLPPTLSRAELEDLVRKHADEDHAICVFDLVIAHPACDAALFDLLLALGQGSSEVANSILTSGKATRAQIEALRESESPSVRDHALFAELEFTLREGDASSFAEVARRYRDHESLGYAVRYRLATHPGTPVEVLRELAGYADETGELARARVAEPDEAGP